MMDGVYVDKKHLRFMVPYDGMVTSDTVKVTNESDTAITFKMKTTTDKNGFVVQPKTGIVAPGRSTEITITYKCDIECNPRLRLDVVPYNTLNTYALPSADFWVRREAVFKSNGRMDSETTEDLTLASLPLYKYNFHVALLTFDDSKKKELDSIVGEDDLPQRNGLVFQAAESTDSILVENHSDAPVVYRVRSTDDSMFRAEPSSGEVGAHASVEVMCAYNGNMGNGNIDRRHFFQVDVANLAHDDPPRFWGDVDAGRNRIEILKHKFKVEIEAPSRYSHDSSPTSSCIGAHGLSFRSHHKNKKPRHDSTNDFLINSASPSWFGSAFDMRNTSQFQSCHAGNAYDDAGPTSLPNVNFQDVSRKTPRSPNNRQQTSSRTLSRTISDVWDNLRRQPSFLLSRNSRRLQRV